MHYFRTTSVQVRRLQVRSRGIRVCVCVFPFKHPERKKKGLKQPFEVGMGEKKGRYPTAKPTPRSSKRWTGERSVLQRREPISVGGACCLCSTLVGSAHRAALRPPAPLLAMFWGLALLGDKDNKAIIGRCCQRHELKKKS